MTTNNYHSRINDHRLSLGLARYSDGKQDTYHQEDSFWRLIVSLDCGSKRLTAIDVTVSDLVAIKSFCDRAIETLNTDGDRAPKDVEIAA